MQRFKQFEVPTTRKFKQFRQPDGAWHPDNPPHLPRSPHEMLAYHGAVSDFDKFKPLKSLPPGHIDDDGTNFHWLTTNPRAASRYAVGGDGQERYDSMRPDHMHPSVKQAWVNTENFKHHPGFDGYNYWNDHGYRLNNELTKARAEGYHGMVAYNVGDKAQYHDKSIRTHHIVTFPEAAGKGVIRSALSDHIMYENARRT